MTLAQYLERRQMTPTAFAAVIGSPPSTVTRVLRGDRSPGLDLIQRIRDATNGAVTADDFLPARSASAEEASAA